MAFYIQIGCITILAYTYAGYPLLLWLLCRFGSFSAASKRPPTQTTSQPRVTIIIPIHNGESIVGDKVANLNSLQYDGGMDVVFVLDGCTDQTEENIRSSHLKWPLNIWKSTNRIGKERALRGAITDLVENDIIVFSDADSQFDANTVAELVKGLMTQGVGVACGEEFHLTRKNDGAGAGESLFYRYENFIKRCQSQLTSMTYVQGGVFAMWKELYPPKIPPGCTQDGVIAFHTRLAGKKIKHSPNAVSYEYYDISVLDDFKRRVRTVSRAFCSILSTPQVLMPWKTGFFPFHLLSHRVLRWFCIPILATSFVAAWFMAPIWLACLAVSLHLSFYILAGIGLVMELYGFRHKAPYTCYYFMYLHIAACIAVARVLLGNRISTWTPSASKNNTKFA